MAAVDVADPAAGDDRDVWREALTPTNRSYYYCRAGLTHGRPSGDVRVVAAEEDGGRGPGRCRRREGVPASGVPASARQSNVAPGPGRPDPGPFDLHTIVSWIPAMPMDVGVWCEDGEGREGKRRG